VKGMIIKYGTVFALRRELNDLLKVSSSDRYGIILYFNTKIDINEHIEYSLSIPSEFIQNI